VSWRTALTLLLLATVAVSGWSVWRHAGNAMEAPGATRSDFVLHDFELVSLDRAGSEAFTLRAPRMQRDPGATSMTLSTPLFLVPDQDGAYWEIRSARGLVPDDGGELRLRGQVVATSPSDGAQPMRIQTEELNLFPSDNRATSAVAVTLTRPGLTMRGRGLRADFDQKQASLLSDVHARYVPSSR
jgi:lipopolysaccharide export system protein LptC